MVVYSVFFYSEYIMIFMCFGLIYWIIYYMYQLDNVMLDFVKEFFLVYFF